MINTVTREQLAASLRAGSVVVLEALPEKYFVDAHLPGARNLPHDRVEQLAPGVAPDKESSIVVYCANLQCRNSHVAAHALARLGYRDVAVYAGGKQDWIEAGLPVERGNRPLAIAA